MALADMPKTTRGTFSSAQKEEYTMPGRTLPLSTDSMVQGLGYFTPDKPSDDAAPGVNKRDNTRKPNLPSGAPSLCEVISKATTVRTIPGWRTGDGANGSQGGNQLRRWDESRGIWVNVQKGGR